jgi:hypothetical protein
MRLEYWEYCDKIEEMAEHLLPRVPEIYKHVFEPDGWGGEYTYMLENMIGVVIENQIPLSVPELAELRALAGQLKDTQFLAMLEQVKPTRSDPAALGIEAG